MTDTVKAFSVTLTGNQTLNTVVYTDMSLGDADVVKIEVVFPPGCAGLVGARLEYTDSPVYPASSDEWYKFDDYVVTIEPTRQGNSGAWRLAAYNNDYYDHAIDVYFSYDYVNMPASSGSSQLVSL